MSNCIEMLNTCGSLLMSLLISMNMIVYPNPKMKERSKQYVISRKSVSKWPILYGATTISLPLFYSSSYYLIAILISVACHTLSSLSLFHHLLRSFHNILYDVVQLACSLIKERLLDLVL